MAVLTTRYFTKYHLLCPWSIDISVEGTYCWVHWKCECKMQRYKDRSVIVFRASTLLCDRLLWNYDRRISYKKNSFIIWRFICFVDLSLFWRILCLVQFKLSILKVSSWNRIEKLFVCRILLPSFYRGSNTYSWKYTGRSSRLKRFI